VVLCGGFSAEVRAKKMRQDGCTEFISDSLKHEGFYEYEKKSCWAKLENFVQQLLSLR